MTPAGRDKLARQLKKMKEVDRPAISKAIEIARGHGDLSENADYDAAKDCLLYTSPSPRDATLSRMPSSA